MNRDQQIALYIYNLGITRSRREYEEHPTACAGYCVRCIHPVGSSPDCETCKVTRRMRRIKAKEKAS